VFIAMDCLKEGGLFQKRALDSSYLTLDILIVDLLVLVSLFVRCASPLWSNSYIGVTCIYGICPFYQHARFDSSYPDNRGTSCSCFCSYLHRKLHSHIFIQLYTFYNLSYGTNHSLHLSAVYGLY